MSQMTQPYHYGDTYTKDKDEIRYYSNLASSNNDDNSSGFIFSSEPTQYHKTTAYEESRKSKKNLRVNFSVNFNESSNDVNICF